jgi:hypothetical protein
MALTLATQPVQHQPQHEHANQGNSGVDLARPGIVPRHWRTCTCAVTVNVTVHVTFIHRLAESFLIDCTLPILQFASVVATAFRETQIQIHPGYRSVRRP